MLLVLPCIYRNRFKIQWVCACELRKKCWKGLESCATIPRLFPSLIFGYYLTKQGTECLLTNNILHQFPCRSICWHDIGWWYHSSLQRYPGAVLKCKFIVYWMYVWTFLLLAFCWLISCLIQFKPYRCFNF